MIVRNWKFFEKDGDIGELSITNGQFMTGNILGIIAEKRPMGDLRGNALNVKSYGFSVRVKLVDAYNGFNEEIIREQIEAALNQLEVEGCRAVITSGGRMGLFDDVFKKTEFLAMSTPMKYLDFASICISSKKEILVMNELSVEENIRVLNQIGIDKAIVERIVFGNPKENVYCNADGQTRELGEKIGAIIWDCIENYNKYIVSEGIPVFDLLRLAEHMKNAVVQLPYEGVI